MDDSGKSNTSFVGGLGALFTSMAVHGVFALLAAWGSTNAEEVYGKLNLPSVAPATIWYGRVWIALYTMLSLVACLLWSKRESYVVENVLVPYLVHLVLQATWSWLFFDLGRADIAFVEILLLCALSFWLMCVAWRVSAVAGLMMMVYLLWLIFAALLNAWILWQNGADLSLRQ